MRKVGAKQNFIKKVQEEEFIKSTMLTRLMVLDTKSPPLITAVTTKLKKVQEEELYKSTVLTRLMVLDTKSSQMTASRPQCDYRCCSSDRSDQRSVHGDNPHSNSC